MWHAAKKYSVNNTLPIAFVNTWLQFSLAYVAAVMITDSDVSFITNILNSRIMPAYVYASVILGIILVASLAIKYMNRQEIKDEKSKDGDSPIDEKIRGGKSDEINEIAQNALTIEIVPDLVDKKQGFSIVLPVSGKQGEILENKRQENRNKVILLTVPYVLSGLIVVGALIQNKFSFANVQGWAEWGFIAFVSAIFIAGVCIALSKLKNNEVNNAHNIVKKFNNMDILLPFRSGTIVSVVENKFESEEENDPISRLIKLLDKHLTDFTDKISDLFDKFLVEAKTSIDEKLLEPANDKIQETLVHLQGIREDIKKDLDKLHLDELHKEILAVLNDAKALAEKANSLDIKGTFSRLENAIKIAKDKIEQFEPSRFVGWFRSTTQSNGNEFLDMLKKKQKEVEKIKKESEEKLKKVTDELEELKNKQTQSNEPNSSLEPEGSTTATPLDKQRDEEKKAIEKNRLLRSIKRTKELEKENAKLEKELPEQEKTDEWKEKINGKPSEFLYYLLESIKLEEKDNKEKKVEATLRNFDNKVTIHWKDGSQTICHIKKQGDLQIESSVTMFTDPNVQAAWEMARG
ncbi:hypothetical protein [Wolbachia endosymbiont (group A) of Anomoia purmunda]|uniref:hypothetical protein n=1 Tax=Wolbachia endosymbiont (group A) of Anomoia purmunda TaxID=2953978 RepID=UPI0022329F73|nr:hypothetical protein [Wolbachia endosymbiont (group A) of Anomoia purmunda]